MTMDMPVEQHAQVQMPALQQELYGIPYDTRPMEGSIEPEKEMIFHGGIGISNQIARTIEIREDFLLHRGGYFIHVFDQETGQLLLSSPSPMNCSYLFLQSPISGHYFLAKYFPARENS